MEDFISRLLTEKEQLDEKISKLSAFLKTDPTIEDVQLVLLRSQLNVMRTYSDILKDRLDRLK